MDADSKIITDYATTSANIHDSNEFSEFLGEDDKVVYADSAYVGKEIPNHVENRVCEKGYRGKPLTDEQMPSAVVGRISRTTPQGDQGRQEFYFQSYRKRRKRNIRDRISEISAVLP